MFISNCGYNGLFDLNLFFGSMKREIYNFKKNQKVLITKKDYINFS